MHPRTIISIAAALAAFISVPSAAQSVKDLQQGFQDPPKESRPRVWWHWMNGNITKDGIRKDLQWMKDAGIAGFHNFDAGLETPLIVSHKVEYMTPEWKDCFRYAIDLADSLDLEVTIAASPGWSETGGPWVKPEDSMKKLVWRQIEAEGGKRPVEQKIVLPEGFDNTGKFQDWPLVLTAKDLESLENKFHSLKFYRDIAVLAVKLCDSDIDFSRLNPSVRTSGTEPEDGKQLEGKALYCRLNGDRVGDPITVNPDKDGWSWIEYGFKEPQTVRSVIVTEKKAIGGENDLTRELQVSDDGISWKTAVRLGYQATRQKTYSFPGITARFFRVRFKDTEKGGDSPFCVSQFILSSVNRIQLAGDKAGNLFYRLLQLETTPQTNEAARLEDVVDLTGNVKDGVLTWAVPEGRWRIFRFGYSLTGKTNHPSSPEATGLEVDKLDPDAVTGYLEAYLDTYRDASGGRLGGRGIQYLLTDSYEAGPQTWTENIAGEFKRRKGYDLLPWLPALTGMILGSTDETERFLFDWRRTLGDMMAEYHYDIQNEVLAKYGMGRYTESHENYRANLTDGMDCKRYAEIPMSAFWMQYKQGKIFTSRFEADIRESASVAHIYGQNIAAAESFTAEGFRDGAWVYSPAVLKPTADAAMASGLNRFVIHCSAHQPVDDKVPGLGLGKYGQWFNRHQTWAGQARSWTDYLSRSCFLLQQGSFVADIALYYGEDNNVTGLYLSKGPEMPEGYAYDYFSPDVLLHKAEAKDGLITVPTGMKYRILYLDPNVRYMSMEILRKIKCLADAGITICGSRPEKMAGNQGDPDEFDAIVKDIWESGRKNVSSGIPAVKVLKSLGVEPDFVFSSKDDPDVRYVHRKTASGDIYWVTNLSDNALKMEGSFRVTGKKPVLWHAEDGSSEPVSYSIGSGRTSVALSLARHQSVFVMFLEDAGEEELQSRLPKEILTPVAEITAPWVVSFQENRGAPATAVFDRLASYTDSEDEGIRYFSGTAVYRNTFSLKKKDLKKAKRIILSLGEVKDIAEVKVNGVGLGTFWDAPFQVDVTKAVRKGSNSLEITVANVWHNRLVGDIQPGVEERITFTQMEFFKPEEPLLPAGLIGPVRILAGTTSE
ncbi:MAG: discoidin domain-containing protein [Bacteroidales bacterium]|nr:discoidin domain-containing protein [Bacteroidales bacterium]